MKLKLFAAVALFSCTLLFSQHLLSQQAQPKKESQKSENPNWAPEKGYDNSVKNIYFPEQNVYFNLDKNTYMYKDGDKWKVISGNQRFREEGTRA